MNNKDFELIRVRIMQEAYELADRNDVEGYNAIKVMCGDVQKMLSPKREWVGLDNDDLIWIYSNSDNQGQAISNTEARLKEKNT